jgi:transaldolase
MPEATLRAFADHGDVTHALSMVTGAACNTLRRAQDAGIDLDAITGQLEREGVRAFCDSYQELLGRIEGKAEGKDRGRADANYSRAVRAGGRRN